MDDGGPGQGTARDPLRIALVGCGRMGQRHAAVIAADPRCTLAITLDRIGERAEQVAERFGARRVDHVPQQIDAVVVATSTTSHGEVAGPLLARGLWCLVEKPLAHSSAVARALASPRCVVGHIERFNPAVRAAGQLSPRVVEARRTAPPTGRSADVDVVLDLMIHDLDLVLGWMAPGATIAWLDAVGVAVQGSAIDTASVRLRSSCGLTASLLASRVAEQRRRQVRCYAPGRYVELDLVSGRATIEGSEHTLDDPRDALTTQWQAFTSAVRGVRPSAAPGEDGLAAVRLAEQIQSVIRESSCEPA
ncbi:MAG TPA: Gfo/Idh/MocA family oxidoreductase [Deltaproteobacteria bacterium]|nr:Gfo/Idh/MocA family oxidoreductase [Deltaproteobacteria bacterium]